MFNDLKNDLLSLFFFRSRGQMRHLRVIWHEGREVYGLLGWAAEYWLPLRLYGEVTSAHSWVFRGANLTFHEWDSGYEPYRRHWIIQLVAWIDQAVSADFATFRYENWRDIIIWVCFEEVRLLRLINHIEVVRLYLHCIVHYVCLVLWRNAIHV